MAGGAEAILVPVEELLLVGHNFPWGRTCDYQREIEEFVFSISRIVGAYDMLEESGIEKPNLLARIFYLARDLDTPYRRDTIEIHLDKKMPKLIERLTEIAKMGRERSLEEPPGEKERVSLARLYSDGEDFFSAQVRDPKRGCSASVCTNCDEPIAYCHYECGVCGYELIGAHGMPTVEEWEEMNIGQRKESQEIGYNYMIRDIRRRGDWRGQDSPLNRYKLKNKTWGGYSDVVDGAPLTRIDE